MEIEKPSYIPTKIFFGRGCLGRLSSALASINAKNILLVTGKSAMRKAGVTQRIEKMLSAANLHLFEQVPQNPTAEIMQQGAEQFREQGIDTVIGLGGGSAMDCAKSIALLINNKGSIFDFIEKKAVPEKNALPIAVIPTTAGTGSEVTMWATVRAKQQDGEMKKYSLIHSSMMPSIAIVDPMLALALPANVTASTGVDAITHAIESYWSKFSTTESEKWAVKALRLLLANIEKAVMQPENIKARENMALGSLYAGFAFSKTMTTACHPISYPLTERFNIPHGHGCMLTMPSFLLFNYGFEPIKGKLDRLAKQLGFKDVAMLAARLQQLPATIGLQMRLRLLGIKKSDIQWIVDNSFTPERMARNPREVQKADLQKILQEIY